MGDYLIVGRCSLDDIPLQLLKGVTLGEATVTAKLVTQAAVMHVARDVFKLDNSVLHGISLVELSPEGVPVSSKKVVEWD